MVDSTRTVPPASTVRSRGIDHLECLRVSWKDTVNGALRDTLIPAASNTELKGLLQTGLTLFGQHQAHAEALAADLKKGQ